MEWEEKEWRDWIEKMLKKMEAQEKWRVEQEKEQEVWENMVEDFVRETAERVWRVMRKLEVTGESTDEEDAEMETEKMMKDVKMGEE